MNTTKIIKSSPFLRWAGGKTWLIKHFQQIVGDVQFNNYHEPFLGGGAVFFALAPTNLAYLSDVNEELINAYLIIKKKPLEIFNELSIYENTKESYYMIRAVEDNDPIKRAARFIYLNQTSYNGLYRVNKNGNYNVPYGYRNQVMFDKEKLLAVSASLKSATISQGDFTRNMLMIQKNDLVFLDPPYTVSHNNNGFIEYNKKLFSLDDQYRLSQFINIIKERQAYYILTNAAHKKILEIFDKGVRLLELERKSLIGGKNSKRGVIKEYIFTNINSEVRL